MLINENTSIAALIKHEPRALEAIVSIAPGFSKLRNPIIRRLMAGRTSIAMAAGIGDCRIEDFYNKLRPLGFTTAETEHRIMPYLPFTESIETLDYPAEKIVELDVRPLLGQGIDPLVSIMKKLSELRSDQALSIVNSFIPSPLINVLSRKGYSHHLKKINDEHYITTFIPKGEIHSEPEPSENSDAKVFVAKLAEYKTRYRELDVRHLEMPLPMTNILEGIQDLPNDHILYVHHKKFPLFLVPELKERGYEMLSIQQNDGVDLLIYRK